MIKPTPVKREFSDMDQLRHAANRDPEDIVASIDKYLKADCYEVFPDVGAGRFAPNGQEYQSYGLGQTLTIEEVEDLAGDEGIAALRGSENLLLLLAKTEVLQAAIACPGGTLYWRQRPIVRWQELLHENAIRLCCTWRFLVAP